MVFVSWSFLKNKRENNQWMSIHDICVIITYRCNDCTIHYITWSTFSINLQLVVCGVICDMSQNKLFLLVIHLIAFIYFKHFMLLFSIFLNFYLHWYIRLYILILYIWSWYGSSRSCVWRMDWWIKWLVRLVFGFVWMSVHITLHNVTFSTDFEN